MTQYEHCTMSLLDIRIDSQKSLDKDKRMTARIAEISQRIACIEKELKELTSDMRMKEVLQKKSALGEMEMETGRENSFVHGSLNDCCRRFQESRKNCHKTTSFYRSVNSPTCSRDSCQIIRLLIQKIRIISYNRMSCRQTNH